MIYQIFSFLFSIILIPIIFILGFFFPKLKAGFCEKCGNYKNLEKDKRIVFYGISVGEIQALEGLIKKTKETFSDVKIVIMTGTPTGQELAKKKFSEIAEYITYFPFDFPQCVNSMIKKIKPSAFLVMETELWPNYTYALHKNKIPFYVINARISDRTFNSYKKLKFIFKPILERFTNVFPQSQQDYDKFIALGAKENTTKIMGNLKFDIKKPDISNLNFERGENSKIILAGSTHSGEDEIALGAFVNLKKEFSNLKLMIASRHPERNEKVFELMQKTGFSCGKRSNNDNFKEKDIILIDTMGELGKLYSVCDIAFLGGSFNKTGGHNPLEATIWEKPVISGACIHNFKDIYAILTNNGAAKIVKTQQELEYAFASLLQEDEQYKIAKDACKDVFEKHSGAVKFVIDVLQNIVK